MSLNMRGFVDGTFKSVNATRITKGGQYVEGIWQEDEDVETPHTVNLQPLNAKEIQTLNIGGERVNDMRKVYVNDGDMYDISPSDMWRFEGIDGEFKAVSMDNRPWRDYCKIIVSRKDD